MAKMDPALKAEWVDRLRNGGIEQAKGRLGRASGSRCCLGVLCDIAAEKGVIDAPYASAGVLWYGERQSHNLPVAVERWSGVQHYGDLPVSIEINGETYISLPGLNDNGVPFSEIADIIDEQF